MTVFESEASLVEHFLVLVESGKHPWGAECAVSTEFDYRRGRADVVAVDDCGRVLAFEAKLKRWKQAMHQAYRNTCFAHRSYVVLPESALPPARRFLSQFKKRKVGLCVVGGDGLLVIEEPPNLEPLQPMLSQAAAVAAQGG